MNDVQHQSGFGVDFFNASPDPMWVFEIETLRIVAVNAAAIELYGYSRDEFVGLSIMDLRPEVDRQEVRERAHGRISGIVHHGVWRHITRDSRALDVDVRSRDTDWHGARAKLMQFRDVTDRRAFEAERARQSEETANRIAAADAAAAHFRALVAALPGLNLVLAPDDFRILSASSDFCDVAGLWLAEIEGRALLDLFEANAGGQALRALEQLRDSGASGALDTFALRERGSDEAGSRGPFRAVITPVDGAEGQPEAIVMRLSERPEAAGAQTPAPGVGGTDGDAHLIDISLRDRQLRSAQLKLESIAARLRSAEHLLNIGSWRYNPDTMQLAWSDKANRIYRWPPGQPTPDIEAYFGMVHPDDREAARETIVGWATDRQGQLEFQHRIIAHDGEVVHVRGLAESYETRDGVHLLGVVQDVTEQVAAEAERRRAADLLRIAGEAARFGGWRVDLATERCEWSPECAAIHDSPGTRQVSLDQMIEFYPDDAARDRIRTIFHRCASDGVSFDEVVDIITAKGREIRARAIGQPARNGAGRIVGVEGALQDITQREEERERAKGLAESLAATLEQMGDAFMTLDEEWRFIFANAHACKLIGQERPDLLGQVFWDQFPQLAGTGLETEFRLASETGESRVFEQYLEFREAWFHFRVHPLRDGVVIYFNDITEVRQSAEHLRLLDAAVAQQAEVLDITDADIDAPDGPRIIFVNPAYERMTGFKREEVLGKTPRISQGPQTDRAELDRIRAALERGEGVRAELINYRKDGTTYWKELDIQPLRNGDGDGEITNYIAVSRDVTERKEAEAALRASEERFALIARASSDAIWDWDIRTGRVWWGEGMTGTFGHPRSHGEGGPSVWEANLHPGEREQVLKALADFVSGTGNSFLIEYRFRRADGSWALVRDYSNALRDEEGRALRLVGGIDDITEERQLEDRLRHSQKLEAVGQLTGGVSHDFNNLLTILIGNAEVLCERLEGDENLRRMAETILLTAERGAELTARLLAYARRQPLDPEVVDVNRAIGSIDEMLRRTLSDSIEIELVRSAGLWPAEIDRGQFDTAVLNLCLNARDAMPEGGKLTIETANTYLDDEYCSRNVEVRPGQYVMVSVSDTGTGMESETLQRAFEPFFTTKPAGRGSGMGLSMVWGFVKQTGGHIALYSEEGEGTTVRLYFPRATGAMVVDEAPETVRSLIGGTAHVLAVEDDADLRLHAVATLRSLGYRVTEAATGAEALEALRSRPDIDILFTDVMLAGGMNGRELAERAVAHQPSLKVLYTSGYTRNAIIHQGRLDPGVKLLSKPYRREDLARRMREVLDAESLAAGRAPFDS